MSDIDAIFNDDDFFTDMGNEKKETPKPKFTPWADGEYYGHIADVESREVNTHKGKHKAMVFNFKVVVDEANASKQYEYKWGNTSHIAKGTEYVGQKIRACGVFRYLVPKEGDDFTANPEGNKSYGYFCEAIGIKLPTVEKEINGQELNIRDMSGNRTLVRFDTGDSISVKSGELGVRFLLVSGKPIKEPVAWHGPIVMNTKEELMKAFSELQNGTFIKPND